MSTASGNDNYPIPEDQAKDSVRLFMNNLTLQPTVEGSRSEVMGNYYVLRTEDGDAFMVNQNSGVVEFAYFTENVPVTADDVTLTSDQARERAKEYAGAKFKGFTGKTWKLVVDKSSDGDRWVGYNETARKDEFVTCRYYDFVFREMQDNVLLPSLVHIRINARTGEIGDYWGIDRLLTVSGLKSRVSLSDAIKTATKYTSDSFQVTSSEGYLAVVTRNQNVQDLAWDISLTGTYKSGYEDWEYQYSKKYSVIVDAKKDDTVLGYPWDSIWPESWLRSYF